MNQIPWNEKYRPSNFESIVLNDGNRTFFKNIIEYNHFPNLLFYGPPGTGKTTTIIQLINEYQKKYSKINKSNIIHLNASDDRGIDIIRNQIYQFVKSNNLFETGTKFVILDEVDYMTKTAQQALKYLLQSSLTNVRFCLICNYISKIDDSLQKEFISVRFNQLPPGDICAFIRHICTNESIEIPDHVISSIQRIYKSDIRSMVNFIQLNRQLLCEEWHKYILNDEVLGDLHERLTKIESTNNMGIVQRIHQISIQYNLDKKSLLNKYFDYVILNHTELVSTDFLDIVDIIVHTPLKVENMLQYFAINIRKYYADCFTPITPPESRLSSRNNSPLAREGWGGGIV
jgi:DNA polymerase III delta prime subunit